MKFFKSLQINALVTAIIFVVLGLVFILWPDMVASALPLIVSGVLVLTGVLYIIQYFRTWRIDYTSNGLAIGILLLFVAAFLLIQREMLAAFVPLLLGFAVVVSGTIKLQNAIVLHRSGDRQWILSLVLAGLSFLLGLIILLNLFSVAQALIVFIGASLLFSGLSDLLMIIIVSRRMSKVQAAIKNPAPAPEAPGAQPPTP